MPGKLNINVSGIMGKYFNHVHIESLFLLLKNKDGIFGVQEIKREDGKSFDAFFDLDITDNTSFKFLLFMKYENTSFDFKIVSEKVFNKNLKKYGEYEVICAKDEISEWHNKFVFSDYKLEKMREHHIFKKFYELFEPSRPEIYGLKTQICYVSRDEEDIIQGKEIFDGKDLNEWLEYREN